MNASANGLRIAHINTITMEAFLQVIQANKSSKECVPRFTKETQQTLDPTDYLWAGGIRQLTPPRLMTAWVTTTDPLMLVGGQGYRSTEVRDKTFQLQQEALAHLRGNRKLTKAKMSDALNSIKPTTDQTKVIAAILLALKQVQTVCFDTDTKTFWTMPEDWRAWSSSYTTLWVDARCEQMLDFSNTTSQSLSKWLSDRDEEGWAVEWPIAEGTYEDIKARAGERGITPRALQPGVKTKKEDWARALGKAEAIEHLLRG